MKKKNLSLMCAAMLAATAIPANFAMADETKDAENLTEWAMDEPVTLTVLKNQNPATVNYADGEDQYNNVYYNAYRDNLGITLDFQICASGDEYSQKVTLAIASDDLPDLLYLPVAEYSQLAEAGKLAPLDDVLEQYGSELTKKNLNSDGGKILEAAKRNDVLYGIPSGNAERIPSQFLWIRKDWLDKLGLDQADVEGKEVENAKKVSEMRRNLENIQLLVRKGSIAEAKNDINEVIAYLTTHSQTENLLAVEAAQSLNAAILSYVNRNGMISLIVEAEHSGAMGTVAYFKKLQELLVNEAEKRIDNTVKSVAKLVVKYINSHISENVSTSVLSDVTGYSSGYLSRIFRQEIGMSIHDYVAQTRMNLAKEMLVNTNLKIYEVAENCGYENTTYFIKIFRISTGITPQDYRLKGKH